MLSAHPEVLRMFDAGERGLNRAALLDIVNSTAFADQPEAARKIVAMAKAKHEPVAETVTDPVAAQSPTVEPVVASPMTSDKPARATRSERTDRRAALGITTAKTLPAKHLSDLLGEFRKASETEPLDMIEPDVFLAFVLGETEIDGAPIADHPSMVEVVRLAKRVGIKVSK
jgi:hypothetical protein